MLIDPSQVSVHEVYKLLAGCVVPRPIAWVSTVDTTGRANLAPFSFFAPVSSRPPTVSLTIEGRDSLQKDTLTNIRETKEFVINAVTEELADAMAATAGEWPPDVDEFELAGLQRESSIKVRPPRVRESPIQMECRLTDIVRVGADSLVLGEVVLFHIRDSLYRNGRIDLAELRAVGRLVGDKCCTTTQVLVIRVPQVEGRGGCGAPT